MHFALHMTRRPTFDRTGARNGSGVELFNLPRSGREILNPQPRRLMSRLLPSSSVKFFQGLVSSHALAVLLLVLAATTAQADWPDNNTNLTKWVQGPDPTISGFDVLVGQGPPGPAATQSIILANDFKCRKTGPITDIHLWTSWFGLSGATTVPPIPITLGIWSDVPAITNASGGILSNSHPGTLLWTNTFNAGQYKVRPWSTSDEHFWDPDPAPQGVILGPDNMIWQYNFYPPAVNTFTQTGSLTAPVVYWLSMTAVNPQTTGNGPFFGWKTSTNVVFDNSVFGHLDSAGTPVGDWNELIDPTKPGRSLDLSFVVTTRSEENTSELPSLAYT